MSNAPTTASPAMALVIDDEVDLCRLMQITLTKMGIKTTVAYDLATAYQYLEQQNPDQPTYAFCLTDMRLPDGSGLDLVKYIASKHPHIPVAVITAHGSMDLAIQSLKLGAFDFVNKPLELPRLRQLVENALKVAKESSIEHANVPQKSPAQQLLDEKLIGDSNPMQKLKSTIIKLARSQAPVFLWGASGTGKEVVAKSIHELSPRRDGSFVPVNCGAIPSELMESEFFGHKKGSFTGATTDKQGLFQQANGGTLFFDEVADLPLAMQVKLLRAIQEKTVRAIGDTKEVPVDIRILSATHKDLKKLVQSGQFREDLFYRINVIELSLPSLNQRSEDIPQLTAHFLNLITEDWQLEDTPIVSEAAQNYLNGHGFSGNVRELRNMLERAVTLADDALIELEHVQQNNSPETERQVIEQASPSPATHPQATNTHTIESANLSQGSHRQDDFEPTGQSTSLYLDPSSNASQSNHVNQSVSQQPVDAQSISHPVNNQPINNQTINNQPNPPVHNNQLNHTAVHEAGADRVAKTGKPYQTTGLQYTANVHSGNVRTLNRFGNSPSSNNTINQTPQTQPPINTPLSGDGRPSTEATAEAIATAQIKQSVQSQTGQSNLQSNLQAHHHTVASSLPVDAMPDLAVLISDAYLDTSTGLPKVGLEAYLQAVEKAFLKQALKQTGWNKTKAAKLLDMTLRSIRYRMEKLQVTEE